MAVIYNKQFLHNIFKGKTGKKNKYKTKSKTRNTKEKIISLNQKKFHKVFKFKIEAKKLFFLIHTIKKFDHLRLLVANWVLLVHRKTKLTGNFYIPSTHICGCLDKICRLICQHHFFSASSFIWYSITVIKRRWLFIDNFNSHTYITNNWNNVFVLKSFLNNLLNSNK